MSAKHASIIIGSIGLDKSRAEKLSEYLGRHDTGLLADFRDHPLNVEMHGGKTFVFYTRIAEVNDEELVRLLFGEES